MIQFEHLKSMSIDELTEWLYKNVLFDESPWMQWFDEFYCSNCKPVMCCYEACSYEIPYAWCERNDKCKFFQEMDEVPSNKEIIKMWLESTTDYIKIKKDTRVMLNRSKEYGTVMNITSWKGRLAYAILVDKAPDFCLLYPEEFTVLESEER